MNKIYVVTSGEYSDYGIDGIFTTEELAQKFIDCFSPNRYNDMAIEVWDLNPNEAALNEGFKPYFLRIDKEGNVSDIRLEDSAYGFKRDIPKGDISYTAGKVLMNLHCYAKDENHAIKIINEKRTKVLALNIWGEIPSQFEL